MALSLRADISGILQVAGKRLLPSKLREQQANFPILIRSSSLLIGKTWTIRQ